MAARLETTRYPGVYRRGSRYVVPYRHNGRQHKPSFHTLVEAREFKGRLSSEGTRRAPTRLTVERYAAKWLPSYQGRTANGFTEHARNEYKRALDSLPLWLRRKRMNEVEREDARDLVEHLRRRGLAPASIKKALVPLRAMFATAVDDDKLRANPFANLRINVRHENESVEEDEQAKAMTRAQLARILAAAPPRWTLLFRLLAHTGLRISELSGLNVGDVQFGAKPKLQVRRQFYRGKLSKLKTRNGKRDLPLSRGMARDLWSHCAGRPDDAPLFATTAGTRHLYSNLRRRALVPTAEAAGLLRPQHEWKDPNKPEPRVGFHTFRHTCASLLFEEGRNIKQVSRWLGHADPAFTLSTYVHLMDEGVGDADFLDEAVGDGGNAMAANPPQEATNAEPAPVHEIAG